MMDTVAFIRKFRRVISLAWKVAVLLCVGISAVFAQTEKSSTAPQFTCPTLPELLRPLYDFSRTLETKYELQYFSFSKLPAPQANIIESAWRYFLVQAEPLIQRQFGTDELSQKVIVVSTDEIGNLGGLFCESAQTINNAIVIFVGPATTFTPLELASEIAHEFVHYYFYKNKIKNLLWFEEGLALFFEFLVTHKLKGSAIAAHFKKPWASLNDFDMPSLMPSAYGHAQLLFLYLYEQLGGDLIQNILATRLTGVPALDAVIKNSPNSPWPDFHAAFIDFEIAKRVNRIDYLASDPNRQKRYFIFSTTRKMNTLVSESASPVGDERPPNYKPLSSQILSTEEVHQLEPRNSKNCFTVKNSLTEPISISSCDGKTEQDIFNILIRN